jgi:hypothetical protein
MQSSEIGENVKPQLGDTTVRRRRHEQQDYDHTGVLVVASAWLIFYGLSFSSLVFKRGTEMLASLLQNLS